MKIFQLELLVYSLFTFLSYLYTISYFENSPNFIITHSFNAGTTELDRVSCRASLLIQPPLRFTISITACLFASVSPSRKSFPEKMSTKKYPKRFKDSDTLMVESFFPQPGFFCRLAGTPVAVQKIAASTFYIAHFKGLAVCLLCSFSVICKTSINTSENNTEPSYSATSISISS